MARRLQDDYIVSVVIAQFTDDEECFSASIDGGAMISAMLAAQSAEIDAISGATYSSERLKAAVRAALNSARG